ncbi:MAG: SDR family NAD(P)-dependent oxidoreductase, partial [Actinomycetota bacterium]
MSGELAERSVVVTGATGGMGRAITSTLAAAGAHVLATDLTDAGADALIAEADGSPGTVRFEPADVADGEQVARIVAAATARTGRLDAAVNAAAIEF